MGMKTIKKIREMLCEELENYEGQSINAGSLSEIDKLMHSIKNADKIMMMNSGEYSHGGDWEARGMYGRSYDDYSMRGNSYRGRMRDSMGRYSRDSGGMIEQLEDMMEQASTTERSAIQRAINEMKNTK